MELTRMCELFSKQALIVGERHWGLFEIMAVQSRDCGKVVSIDVGQSEPWVEQTHAYDDVLAFVPPSDNEWLQTALDDAFAIYEASEQTDRDWDTFRVTARLLV